MSVAEKKPRLVKPAKRPPAPKKDQPVRHSAVVDFQTDAIALEERRPPITARLTLYMVAAAICAGVAWASVSMIDEVVVAPGKLVTSQPTLVIQPLETSIIRDITVKPGDRVSKGQLLATLDPTFSASDEGQVKTRIAGFAAQIARLRAELDGQTYAPGPDASPEQAIQGQLFAQRRLAYTARLADFDAQISNIQASLDAARAQQTALDTRIAGLQEIEGMRSDLAQSGNGSRLAMLESRDLVLDLRVSQSQLAGQHAEASEQLKRVTAERQNYIEDYRRVSLEALADLEDKNNAAREDMRKAALRAQMSQLFAPADAAVLEVAERSVSSVVQPAEPLITLVPVDVPLEVDVMVASNDIGHVAVGNLVRIKLDAFPFQTYGTLSGTVRTISSNSFAPPEGSRSTNGSAVYRVRIELGGDQLRNMPADFLMLPGMTVSAEIHAGERTVISYFLHPLVRGLDEALGEP